MLKRKRRKARRRRGYNFSGHARYDLVLVIDANERKKLKPPPFLWWTPRYNVEPVLLRVGYVVKRIPFGDYYIKGYRRVTCTDRKFSIRELDTNLRSSRAHEQARRFTNLCKGCKYPIVFLDMRWSDAFPRDWPDAHAVWDTLFRWQARYGFEIVGPVSGRSPHTRIRATELLIRMMLARIVRYNKQKGIDNGELFE